MLLTIEHCDRCEEHAHSTRHDPHKYAYFAQSLKTSVLSRFPIVRVLIKPRSGSPDAVWKLGAFEVQLFCKDGREATKTVLHSKLESLQWPDINELMVKLASHMPRSNLFITLYDSLNTNVVLKGLRVRVKPKASLIKQRPTSANSKSSRSRPRSANPKLPRPPSAMALGSLSSKPTNTVERITNDGGSSYFERLAKDIYDIEVVESSEYSAAVKTVNLFEEDAASVNLYIPVVSRTVSCFTVLLRDAETKHEITGAKVALQATSAEHVLNEVSSGVYQVSIKFGDYALAIEHRGHMPLKRKVSLVQQIAELKETLQPEKKRYVEVVTVDAFSGERLNVLVQMTMEGSKSVHEGMTDGGSFKFQVEQQGAVTFQVSKRGYLEMRRTVVTSLGDCVFFIPLLRDNHGPLSLVTFKDPGERAQCVVIDESENLKRNGSFESTGVSVVSCSSKFKWLRIGVEFSNPGAVAAHLYSDSQLLAELNPPKVAGSYWDIMGLGHKHLILLGTVTRSPPKTHKLHLKDFAQMSQLVIKAESSIEDIFGFTSTETPVVRKGAEAFIHPLILQQLFEAEASSDAVTYLSEGLDTGDGVSLSSLKQTFGLKTAKAEAFNVISLEELASDIGLKLPDDAEYLYIAEEALEARLPDGWEYRYDGDSWVYYDNDQGQYSDEHPLLVNFRARLIEAKRAKEPPKAESPQEEAKTLQNDASEAKYSDDFDARRSPNISDSVSDTGFEERIGSHIHTLKANAYKWVRATQAEKRHPEEEREHLKKQIKEARDTLNKMVKCKQTGLDNKSSYKKDLKKAKKKLRKDSSSSSDD